MNKNITIKGCTLRKVLLSLKFSAPPSYPFPSHQETILMSVKVFHSCWKTLADALLGFLFLLVNKRHCVNHCSFLFMLLHFKKCILATPFWHYLEMAFIPFQQLHNSPLCGFISHLTSSPSMGIQFVSSRLPFHSVLHRRNLCIHYLMYLTVCLWDTHPEGGIFQLNCDSD